MAAGVAAGEFLQELIQQLWRGWTPVECMINCAAISANFNHKPLPLYSPDPTKGGMMRIVLMAAAVAIIAGGLSACADDGYHYPSATYYSFSYADPTYNDYAEHERFHQEFGAAHEEAHEQGFRSPEEHEAWHRAYGETHERFHEDHPDAW